MTIKKTINAQQIGYLVVEILINLKKKKTRKENRWINYGSNKRYRINYCEHKIFNRDN